MVSYILPIIFVLILHFSHSFPYFRILISSLKWQVVSYAFSPYDFPVYYSYIDFRTKMAVFLICVLLHFPHMISVVLFLIELDDGKIYRKPLYLMVKTMVSCRFSLKPIHWISMCPIFSKPLPPQASSHVSCSSTPAAGGWSLHLAYQKPAEVVHLLASAQCEA